MASPNEDRSTNPFARPDAWGQGGAATFRIGPLPRPKPRPAPAPPPPRTGILAGSAIPIAIPASGMPRAVAPSPRAEILRGSAIPLAPASRPVAAAPARPDTPRTPAQAPARPAAAGIVPKAGGPAPFTAGGGVARIGRRRSARRGSRGALIAAVAIAAGMAVAGAVMLASSPGGQPSSGPPPPLAAPRPVVQPPRPTDLQTPIPTRRSGGA